MYGFSDPTVRMLIQELDNSDKCTAYKKREFIIGETSVREKDKPPKSSKSKTKSKEEVTDDVSEL